MGNYRRARKSMRRIRKSFCVFSCLVFFETMRDRCERCTLTVSHFEIHRYGHEGVDDNVEFDEDRDGSSDDKEIDVDEI